MWKAGQKYAGSRYRGIRAGVRTHPAKNEDKVALHCVVQSKECRHHCCCKLTKIVAGEETKAKTPFFLTPPQFRSLLKLLLMKQRNFLVIFFSLCFFIFLKNCWDSVVATLCKLPLPKVTHVIASDFFIKNDFLLLGLRYSVLPLVRTSFFIVYNRRSGTRTVVRK